MGGALDIQDMEELNSASDSETNQFTEYDMLDPDDDTIVADNSGMSDIGSSSSSDEQETEEEDGHEADNEYGDYHDDLIDEVIGKQLDRNPPNWSPNNYQDFIVPDYTRPPDTPNLPADFDISTAKAIDYFSCISHNYLKIWFSIQITMHNTAY